MSGWEVLARLEGSAGPFKAGLYSIIRIQCLSRKIWLNLNVLVYIQSCGIIHV